ncbi:uncharacterized protein LOC133391394 [Anopheles gambiae]|uniref:uncharacterized protein LOC133391394 n=1 Tax=Anopheles gambiae TaxID=7165 RepID=UPI002AC9D833|nr:uncharacterized protein LOC133391394 [Anopheles gambiae]
MSNMKRARKTGNIYHRANKYSILSPSRQDQQEASSSRHNVEEFSAAYEWQNEYDDAMEDGHQDTVQHDEGDSVQDGDANFTDDSDVEAGSALNIDNMSIEDGIRYWALSNNQTHQSINMVLRLFKKTGVKVPASAKTLLKTKRNPSSEIKDIDGGQFWYRGFRSCLLNYFRSVKVPPKYITLTLSIDGLPLHNSSNMQFWPILFKIEELPQAPVMAAAIFCGFQKPNNIEEFLRPAVDELNLLMANGIIIHGKKVVVKMRAIVADTPARAFIKGVKGHTGYNACLKCTVEGNHSEAGHTIVYANDSNARKRTNEKFRKYEYPGHQITTTPLCQLNNFDIVQHVTISDLLHLFHLGIMKRLIIGWRDGKLGKRAWSQEQCQKISAALLKINLPSEMHRKLRSIKYANFWKGVEFGYFLNYAGLVVLKPHLPNELFNHFMLLFCAVTLLSSNVYKTKWKVAGQLLDKFVKDFETLYGERYISSNVHNLRHVLEEVEHF